MKIRTRIKLIRTLSTKKKIRKLQQQTLEVSGKNNQLKRENKFNFNRNLVSNSNNDQVKYDRVIPTEIGLQPLRMLL